MAFLHSFIGIWEINECRHVYHNRSISQRLEGVRFKLEENGDVTWTIPSDDLKSIPLFSCETYELYSTSSVLGPVLRFGAYAGHVLEFRCIPTDPRDEIVMTCENWCNLKCKRIYEDNDERNCSIPFSLLPALEDGYFSDITITSFNKKQFKVHSCILKLHGKEIDWNTEISIFSNLSEDVLGTILHFLYAECLPENLTESVAEQVIQAATPYPYLNRLVNICNLYLKNMALKQQIIGLVNDMHGSMNQIIDHFTIRTNPVSSDNIASNPSKLCFIVKQSIRDVSVAGVKLILLCDLFTKHKNELSKEERNEIIHYAKSRLPIFLTQFQRFLQSLKLTFGTMSTIQRLELARFLVPEIEIILDTVPTLFVQIEKALQQIIQGLTPNDCGNRLKFGVGDLLGRSLKHVLHIRELTKIKNFHEHISCSLGLFIHKRENFRDMTSEQKVRSIARNLEQLIEELPLFLLRLEEVCTAFDEKLEWREFKFCFKVGTSKVSRALQKLINHRDVLQEIFVQLCELIQRDAFNQSLQSLGLLDTTTSSSSSSSSTTTTSTNSSDYHRIPCSSSNSSPKHHNYKLNLVESFCTPPSSNISTLSKLSLELFQNSNGADMEFEIVGNYNHEQQQQQQQQNENDNQDDEQCVIIKAHRVIVAARCDWFRRALLSGMREAIDKKIIIHDTSPFLFRIFLEYLYSGRLRQESLSIEQLIELLLLSDRYEVDTLKNACEYALQQNIDIDSALYFFNMADQYNARILKSACLNFIGQHHELTESEIFFELPITLQAEIFDCVWTQPPPPSSTTTPTAKKSPQPQQQQPPKSGTMEQLLPSSITPNSPDSSDSDHGKVTEFPNFTNYHHRSNNSSIEDLQLEQDSDRLDDCISQLRDIVGDNVARDELVEIILAADYDLCRAVNFYYGKNPDEE